MPLAAAEPHPDTGHHAHRAPPDSRSRPPPGRRRGRLPAQAIRVRRAARPAAGPDAPRAEERPCEPAAGRRSRPRSQDSSSPARRHPDRADRAGVRAPRVLDAPSQPGADPGADRGARVGLQLRRNDEPGRRLHLVPARQDRRGPLAEAHPNGVWRRLPAVGMMFRGALVRLAAQYFVLLVLILGFFDLIVYVTVSQALQAKADKDLHNAIAQAMVTHNVTGDTVSVTPQALLTPNVADNLVRVLDYKGQEIGQPRAELKKLFNDPSLRVPLGAANAGRSGDTRVSYGTELYVVAMRPIASKTNKVIGVLQVAQPISWVGDALSRLVRQLVLASGVGIVLGALASLLMATRSLRPISRAFQRQREFVADASHELRTPLTLIRTNVEAWLRRANGTNRLYARNIVEEVEQLNRIVGDLTTLALADARQLRIDPRPMELNEVVKGLIVQATPLAEERGVQLRPELNGGVRVEADPARVRQLLLILIDNALTHTPSGGEVSVEVIRRNGRARVTIADNGDGIPPADLPHIFERFYRADKARNRENGGSGLGLGS